MKRRDLLKAAPFAATAFSCSGADENPIAETSAGADGFRADKPAIYVKPPSVEPDYDSYDVVISDWDGWLIEFNGLGSGYGTNRTGRVRYKKNQEIIECEAYGSIIGVADILHITFHDSGWTNLMATYAFNLANQPKTGQLFGSLSYHREKRQYFTVAKILKSTFPGLVVTPDDEPNDPFYS